MFASQSTIYKLLNTSESDDDERKGSQAEVHVEPKGAGYQLSVVTVIFCILCTVANVVLAIVATHGQGHRLLPSQMTPMEVNKLRRPSQYIRFDEVSRPSIPVPKQFNNFPLLVSHIDSATPTVVFEDSTTYMSHEGTITPEDKRVLVTDTMSSVVQFRAIDYGMETCELHVRLPKSAKSDEYPSLVSLYRLETSLFPLDGSSLSFNSRPRRISKLTELHSSYDTEVYWHRKFACSLEEILTFELACSGQMSVGHCSVDWWQLTNASAPGIFLVQHATK